MVLTEQSLSESRGATEVATPARPGPRWVVALLALAGLVAIFAGGYALGHDDPTHVPAAALPSTASVPATSSTGPGATAATATTATTFATNESGAVEFFTTTAVEPTINGPCSENLDFTWTFDPAKTPADLTDVAIAVTGPGVSSTDHVAAFRGKVELNMAVNLEVAQGTWTAVVVSVGSQAAVPQPISIDVAGC